MDRQFRELYDNSTVSISGGQISAPFRAFDTSNVNLSGGAVKFDSSFDSEVSLTIFGSGFHVDGQSVQNLGIGEQAVMGLADHHELSGILEDGTPFVLFDADSFDMGTVTLTGAALPPLEALEFNVPDDIAPQTLRGPQTVTVADGGRLPGNFRAGHESTVRILNGGQVSSHFMSFGANVEITGGRLGPFANAFGGSTISLNGGSIDSGLFAVNSTIDLHDGKLESRTGTSPFIATNSVVNVVGGDVIGSGFTAFQSTINLSAGTISFLTANDGSEVNVLGGILNNFRAESGTLVNISGGVVQDFSIGQETTVNISGGTVVPASPNRIPESSPGTTIAVSGGLVVDNQFYVPPGGEMKIRGGEFRIDGNEVPDVSNIGDMVSLPFEYPSTITATLSDGTPFIYQRGEFDRDMTLTLIADEVAPNDGPRQITAPVDTVPQSLRDGQSLTVDDGGLVLDYFRAGAGSSVLLKSGGQIGHYMDLATSKTLTVSRPSGSLVRNRPGISSSCDVSSSIRANTIHPRLSSSKLQIRTTGNPLSSTASFPWRSIDSNR